MGNSLEFLLKLTDMLTPGMRQAARISQSTASQIAGEFAKIESKGKRMGASVDELRARLGQLNKVRFSTTITEQFNLATRAANKLERQIAQLEGRGRAGGGGGMGMLGGMMAGAGVFGAVKSTLGAAAEREQQQVSFGVMTGSKATGDKMLGDIVQMGAKTPYESGDLIRAAQTMKQFGIENKAVLPNLQMLGDVAGGNAEKLQSLSLAFSQVQSTGRLQGQDLMQLINGGFNPLLVISQKTGMSMGDLKKKMEDGAISADMVTSAFQSATGPGGQFYKMMEQQSNTLTGRWSTFMDEAKQKLLGLGQVLMPVASAVLTFGSALMNGAPWAVAIAGAIGLFTIALSYNTIATSVAAGWASIIAFKTAAWTAAQWLLNGAMVANPIGIVVAVIVALIAVIAMVIYKTEGWGKQWDSVMKFVRFSWAAFKDYFHLIWLGVQDSFMTGIELIKRAWYGLKSLWDEEGAAAGLASLSNEQNQRAAEIAKVRGSMQQNAALAAESLKWELTWNNKKGFGTIVEDIKGKLGMGGGVSPITATLPTTLPTTSFPPLTKDKNGGGGAKSRADAINGGGQRSITITIGKQIEKLEVHVMNAQEGAAEIESMVREALRRVIYSTNAIAS